MDKTLIQVLTACIIVFFGLFAFSLVNFIFGFENVVIGACIGMLVDTFTRDFDV